MKLASQINLHLENNEDHYLRSCARIRQLSVSALCTRLLLVICQDQLVAAVLDDESKVARRHRGERAYDMNDYPA